MQAESPWQIWIDTGGTFTDCIAADPSGELHRCKVLSSGALRDRVTSVEDDRLRLAGGACLPDGFPIGMELFLLGEESGVKVLEHDLAQGAVQLAGPVPEGARPGAPIELRSGEEAPLLATRLITGTPLGGALPPVAMRLATTRGTNALLERVGARTAHFITAGFEDLLHIGGQQRPDLFPLQFKQGAFGEINLGIDETPQHRRVFELFVKLLQRYVQVGIITCKGEPLFFLGINGEARAGHVQLRQLSVSTGVGIYPRSQSQSKSS